MLDKNDHHKIVDYINNITDKNSPILKTIGYYLNDQECVEELKEYFNSRLCLLALVIIIMVNILLIGNIIFIIFSYYHVFMKMIFISIFLWIDYILVKRYKHFMSLSYSYRLIYTSIQSIPKEILYNIYDRIMKKDLYNQ